MEGKFGKMFQIHRKHVRVLDKNKKLMAHDPGPILCSTS